MKEELYELAKAVVDTLRHGTMTIATAESCTGGLLASTITNVEHSSAAFRFGYVVYHPVSKNQLLGIPNGIINHYGVVSEPVAVALATQALELSEATVAVGITGNIGNTTNDDKGKLDDVWIGLAYKHCGTTKTKAFNIDPGAEGDEVGPESRRVHAKDKVVRFVLLELIKLFANDDIG